MKTTALFTPLMLSGLKPRAREYTVHDAQCPGLALRIQPSGARSWVCWQRAEGRTRRVTLGRFPAVSLGEARKAFLALQAGTVRPVPVQPPNTPSFTTVAHAFLTAKRGVYRPSTLKALRSYLDTQLCPVFGDRPMHRITAPEVAAWFHAYSRNRGGGANQALGHFNTIFNWARSTELLPVDLPNPAEPVRPNRRPSRGTLLSFEELDKLAQALAFATDTQRPAANAVRLMVLTGCRSGEILRLRWAEIQGDQLRLRQTKTGPRVVNLSDAAREVIDTLDRHPTSRFVFPSPRDPRKPRENIDGAWTIFKREARLSPTLRLHDLRHTYASHAIMSGETLFMTGKLLGHRSTKSTERYTHLDGAFLTESANKVANRVAELLGP